jgi:hypothetical protein
MPDNFAVLDDDHSYLNVDQRDAVGDGVTDDTDALTNTINETGTNGYIQLTAKKTYLVSGELTLLQGQTLIGNGATIKRADEVTTTSETNIATPQATTTITVADASNFRVGMYITVWDGVNPTTTGVWDFVNRKISVISDNDITVSTAFNPRDKDGVGTAITTTVTVLSSHEVLVSTATDVSIYNISVDGNLANNTTLERWENHVEIDLFGDRSIVENCYVYNAQSEGLLLGGDGTTARGNVISNTNGNGIHLGACNGITIDGNWLYNTNILGAAPGHADGAISISTDVVGATITNNYLDGNSNSIAFLGGINQTTSDLRVVDNYGKDTTTYAIEASTAFATVTSTFLVANNTFDNCVKVEINDTGSGSGIELNNINITGNIFRDTLFDIRGSNGVSITNNVIDNLGETALQAVQITTSNNVAISGNSMVGGTNVVIVNSGDNIILSNNFVKDGTTGTNSVFVIGGGTNVSVVGNVIEAANVSSSSAIINLTTPDVLVQGNLLNVTSTAGFVIGIHATSTGDRARIIGNDVRIGTSEAAILVNAGADDSFVSNNFTTSDIYIYPNTCFVNGNRVEGAGKTILVIAGATNNVVTNNATTAALSDSGTGTVTASQNHTL